MQGLPAVLFLTIYVVLLFCIPARLIFAPLGAAGTPANVFGIAGLIWWLMATMRGFNPVVGWTPVRLILLLLTVSILASYAAGMAHGWYAPMSAKEPTSDILTLVPPSPSGIAGQLISSADRSLLRLAGWLGVALMTAEGLRSWVDVATFVRRIVWCATYVASLGMMQFFTGVDIAGLYRIPGLRFNGAFGSVDARSVLHRPASTASHAIEYGVVMAAVIPLAIHYAMYARNRRFAAVPLILISVGCAMSVSRSAVLTAGLAMAIVFVGSSPSWRLKAIQIVPFGVIATRIMVPGLVGTLLALFTNFNNDISVKGRTDDYHVVGWIFSLHPWLGQGLGTFIPEYYRILDNQVLDIAIELGIVGVVVVGLFYAVSFMTARRAYRFALAETGRHLGLVISASIAGVALSLITFDAWTYPMVSGVTFLFVGLAGATWTFTRDENNVAALLRRTEEKSVA